MMNSHASTTTLEQEVKFYLAAPDEIRKHLARLGAETYQGRVLETNIRYDSPDGALTRQGKVLRLRKTSHCILTYKQPESATDSANRTPARRHLETEIILDDWAPIEHILSGLGFQPIIRYEKYREVFRLQSTLIMLDQLPFGNFVELEGQNLEELRQTAEQLGMEWNLALQTSYMGIFLMLKKAYKLNSLEATFQTFSGWDAQKTIAVLSTLSQGALHDRQAI
jgi:adenylate cyclase, class 2